MDGNVFKLWTTLEDKEGKAEPSESEDELDQLSHDVIAPNLASPRKQGNSVTTPTESNGPQPPHKFAFRRLSETPKAPKEFLEGKKVQMLGVKGSLVMEETSSGISRGKSGLQNQNTLPRAESAPAKDTSARLALPTPPALLTELPVTSEATSNLADALSSAFNRNAEDPYPSPKNLAGTARDASKREKRGRNEPHVSAARNSTNVKLTANVVSGRRPIQVWQPELVEGPRATKGRQRGFKLQRAIEDHLDVQHAPIDLGHGQESEITVDGDVEIVASHESADRMPDAHKAVIDRKTREFQSNKFVEMNLRHILSSRTGGADSQTRPGKPQIERPPSYAVSAQSYTAMYLERAGEWFKDHELGENATEVDLAEPPHGSREFMFMPSPQIPRQQSLTGLHSSTWDNPTSPSVDADETETSEITATPPPPEIRPVGSVPSTPSNGSSAVTGVLGKRKLGETEETLSPTDIANHHSASLDPYHSPKSNSANDSSILLNAVSLLQRLVKGKSLLKDEELNQTRVLLEALGQNGETIYSKALETSPLEDRTCFFKLISQLISETSLGLDTSGISEVDGKSVKEYAHAVARKYGALNAENNNT
ncbi:hypothetical protein AAF712_006993 [Marasmius tenuissimus]|uniref:Uncharacterized protein n=1 Tax=Marasmius tenuissimus TaxID=585030 RepID=A0ABR2ZYX9_9AGAR